ncbi:MAG: alpha/beta fold hydrolase, partial [Bacteroidetes bacterium]
HPDAGKEGMRAARAMALITYRSYEGYAVRQPEDNDDKLDGFQASSYQQYQGEKLYRRFDAFAYWTLSKAMDSHNVGRGRGGVAAALGRIKARTLVLGVSSDVLFPPEEQRFLAKHIPGARYEEIHSIYGHDGFLVESVVLSRLIRHFLTDSPSD